MDDMVARARARFPRPQHADDGLIANELADEVERCHRIGRALLYHDERGQGIGWQEAMTELASVLEYEKDQTDEKT